LDFDETWHSDIVSQTIAFEHQCIWERVHWKGKTTWNYVRVFQGQI